MKKNPVKKEIVFSVRKDVIKRNVALQILRHQVCIEGDMVTLAEIAKRIGKTKSYVTKRMQKLREQPGAITWAALRGEA